MYVREVEIHMRRTCATSFEQLPHEGHDVHSHAVSCLLAYAQVDVASIQRHGRQHGVAQLIKS